MLDITPEKGTTLEGAGMDLWGEPGSERNSVFNEHVAFLRFPIRSFGDPDEFDIDLHR